MSIARDMVETAHNGDDDQNRGRKCHEHREDSNNGVCRQRHSKASAVEIGYGCDGFNGSLREALLRLLGGEIASKRTRQLAESEETLLEERTSCLFCIWVRQILAGENRILVA